MTRKALAAAGGALLCALAFAIDPRVALVAYLCGWLFLLGLTLGALANLLLHALTGGRWFAIVRAPLAACAGSIGLVSVLFLPLLIATLAGVAPWIAADAARPGPQAWLSPTAFAIRSVAYLLLWNLIAMTSVRLRARYGAIPAGAAAAGLILYVLSITAAAFDWIAALQPGWYSSGLGLILIAAQAQSAMALAIIAGTLRLPAREPGTARRERLNDLGNLLLMFVLLLAYVAFVQFLIIWAENLPREIAWYVPRLETSWLRVGLVLLIFQFAMPTLVLLSRAAKRKAVALRSLAAAVLAANLLYVLWLILPTLRPGGIELHWCDLFAGTGLIAFWATMWRARLHRTVPAHV